MSNKSKAGLIVAFILVASAIIYWAPQIKRFNYNIKYSPSSYRPYDTQFFYETLKKTTNKKFLELTKAPSAKTLNGYKGVYVICSPRFFPDETEKRSIYNYIAAGNSLVLSSFTYQDGFFNGLTDSIKIDQEVTAPLVATNDSLSIIWENHRKWTYPGSAINSNLLFKNDSSAFTILATTANNTPAFIQFNYGKGTVYLMLEPMSLSNYFLLHKENATYLEQITELLGIRNKNVIFDKYYINLKNSQDRSKSSSSDTPKGESYFLKMLKNNPPLLWAVATFIFASLLFLLNYSRRLREPVKTLPIQKNDSLEFSKAIAELYWARKDNTVIAQKIKAQVLEHLYHTYRILAKDLTKELLVLKTNKTENEVEELLSYLNQKEPFKNHTLSLFYKIAYKFIYK